MLWENLVLTIVPFCAMERAQRFPPSNATRAAFEIARSTAFPPDFLSLPVTAVRNCSFRSRVSPNLITRGEAPVRRSRRVGISEFREA